MRPARITDLPILMRVSAMARPMPPPPPVIRAHLKERVETGAMISGCYLGVLKVLKLVERLKYSYMKTIGMLYYVKRS